MVTQPTPLHLADRATGAAGDPARPGGPPAAVRFGILGPLEAYDGDRPLRVGPFKQQVVLGLLLCRANRTVSVTALREALWDDSPPPTADKNVQVYVCALRKVLRSHPGGRAPGSVRLVHSPPGYQLQIGTDQLDSLRFRDLARSGRAAARDGDVSRAADLLGRAVRMWRGHVLPHLEQVPAIAERAGRLREQYLAAYEDWSEAQLALGLHTDVVEELNTLARRHPFRERLRRTQLLALFRSGRHTEALAEFDAMRQLLARELGLRPSPVLTRLYEAILAGDRGLLQPTGRDGPVRGRAAAAAGGALPRGIADFTGRVRHVAALLDTLRAAGPGTVVGVSGTVGVGKTALAVHCARQLGDGFPGGRIFVSMRTPAGAPRPAPEVVDDILAATPPEDARPRERTAEPVTLVVLDDAATETQVRAVLAAVGENAVVLVTSRRYLGGLESARQLTLDAMPRTEAVQMLGRLVGVDRVAAEPHTARRLAAACGGLPLAVRIVGAKLAGLRHLSLARYAERLADERRLLDELAVGDLRLRDRIAISLRDLDPGERRTLVGVAALSGAAFTCAEVAAALAMDIGRAEAAIERLVEARLVEARDDGYGTRYAVPPLIRLFVRER